VLVPQNLPVSTPMGRLSRHIRFGLRALGLLQALALVAAAARIAWVRLLRPLGDRPAREVREARIAAQVLGALKGPFAKVAQFATVRVDALSPEARQGLAELRDRVPPLPFAWIREVIESELGAPLAASFAAFEPRPMGAASIAQVHRARLPDGTPVAVKVQYPWLERSLPADLALLHLGWRWFQGGGAGTEALFREFATGLREELDFRREARIAHEIAANLSDDPRIVVPRVLPSHSSRRVLTMELHPTLPLTDRAALVARGVPLAAVLEVVARAYARQVFVDGLFHADPHPGNLFVLDEPAAATTPRVLFVDFGLSKRLTPELRRELRRGMQRMGMIAEGSEERVREAVTGMLARIRGESGGALGMSGERVLALKDEAKRLLYETEGLNLPTDLLLYAKTLSYVFRLGGELAPEVDMMRLSVPYLLRFLAERE
jgi:ubiquinone biosynthesis protein